MAIKRRQRGSWGCVEERGKVVTVARSLFRISLFASVSCLSSRCILIYSTSLPPLPLWFSLFKVNTAVESV
jgi:hypothetical protein